MLFKNKDLKRAYNIPGGQVFKFIVAFFGMLTSIGALIISFFPPSQLTGDSIKEYLTILSLSFIVTVLIPFTHCVINGMVINLLQVLINKF